MTNNVKTPRYLEPSEIELWELAKAVPEEYGGPWATWNTGDKTYGWQIGIVEDGDGKRLGGDIGDTEEWAESDWYMTDLIAEHDDGRDSRVPAYIAGASPDKIAALLETLEKTRALLREFYDWRYVRRPWTSEDERVAAQDAMYDRARTLLSGFSGDASKEGLSEKCVQTSDTPAPSETNGGKR